MTLSVGQKAPDFTGKDQHGTEHTLAEYAGRWLLLYFYPKDDTPGCTKEACGFRDAFAELREVVDVVGVSKDSVESHGRFVEKYDLPFTLLADPALAILTAYGIGTDFPKRTSFLIDPQGVIQKIYDKVEAEAHAAEILRDVRAMA